MTTPAIVDRDPIVVAIGSEGTAPVLTRVIKTQQERMLPQTLGGLTAMAGRLRPSVTRNVPHARRRAFWAWVFNGAPRNVRRRRISSRPSPQAARPIPPRAPAKSPWLARVPARAIS